MLVYTLMLIGLSRSKVLVAELGPAATAEKVQPSAGRQIRAARGWPDRLMAQRSFRWPTIRSACICIHCSDDQKGTLGSFESWQRSWVRFLICFLAFEPSSSITHLSARDNKFVKPKSMQILFFNRSLICFFLLIILKRLLKNVSNMGRGTKNRI